MRARVACYFAGWFVLCVIQAGVTALNIFTVDNALGYAIAIAVCLSLLQINLAEVVAQLCVTAILGILSACGICFKDSVLEDEQAAQGGRAKQQQRWEQNEFALPMHTTWSAWAPSVAQSATTADDDVERQQALARVSADSWGAAAAGVADLPAPVDAAAAAADGEGSGASSERAAGAGVASPFGSLDYWPGGQASAASAAGPHPAVAFPYGSSLASTTPTLTSSNGTSTPPSTSDEEAGRSSSSDGDVESPGPTGPEERGRDVLSAVINYNLLAMTTNDSSEALTNMLEAFLGNYCGPNICAVLLSATDNDMIMGFELTLRDEMRAHIRETIIEEGRAIARGETYLCPPYRLAMWREYAISVSPSGVYEFGPNFEELLEMVGDEAAMNFMVIHRTNRVLKKPGQYQDLMLLCAGHLESFTYTDTKMYGHMARKAGEPNFYMTLDVANLHNSQVDYTLILDADTRLPEEGLLELLDVAHEKPRCGIIQPAVRLYARGDDPIFMHIECLRQEIMEPQSVAFLALLGQSSFFGKGLVKNDLYIKKVIGVDADNLVEALPIDVLSHDTIEAAFLKAYYVPEVHLLEAPPLNFVAWHLRERRWNLGEIILIKYFFPRILGNLLPILQRVCHFVLRRPFYKPKLRTHVKLDFVTKYVAHTALRVMFLKPVLLCVAFVLCVAPVQFVNGMAQLGTMFFIVMIMPKLVVLRHLDDIPRMLFLVVADFVQHTPEALIGTLRLAQALWAFFIGTNSWKPQRSLEDEMRHLNPMLVSFKELWPCFLAAAAGMCFALLGPMDLLNLIIPISMLASILALPIYASLTMYTPASLQPHVRKWLKRIVLPRQRKKRRLASGAEDGQPPALDGRFSVVAADEDAKKEEDVATDYSLLSPQVAAIAKMSVKYAESIAPEDLKEVAEWEMFTEVDWEAAPSRAAGSRMWATESFTSAQSAFGAGFVRESSAPSLAAAAGMAGMAAWRSASAKQLQRLSSAAVAAVMGSGGSGSGVEASGGSGSSAGGAAGGLAAWRSRSFDPNAAARVQAMRSGSFEASLAAGARQAWLSGSTEVTAAADVVAAAAEAQPGAARRAGVWQSRSLTPGMSRASLQGMQQQQQQQGGDLQPAASGAGRRGGGIAGAWRSNSLTRASAPLGNAPSSSLTGRRGGGAPGVWRSSSSERASAPLGAAPSASLTGRRGGGAPGMWSSPSLENVPEAANATAQQSVSLSSANSAMGRRGSGLAGAWRSNSLTRASAPLGNAPSSSLTGRRGGGAPGVWRSSSSERASAAHGAAPSASLTGRRGGGAPGLWSSPSLENVPEAAHGAAPLSPANSGAGRRGSGGSGMWRSPSMEQATGVVAFQQQQMAMGLQPADGSGLGRRGSGLAGVWRSPSLERASAPTGPSPSSSLTGRRGGGKPGMWSSSSLERASAAPSAAPQQAWRSGSYGNGNGGGGVSAAKAVGGPWRTSSLEQQQQQQYSATVAHMQALDAMSPFGAPSAHPGPAAAAAAPMAAGAFGSAAGPWRAGSGGVVRGSAGSGGTGIAPLHGGLSVTRSTVRMVPSMPAPAEGNEEEEEENGGSDSGVAAAACVAGSGGSSTSAASSSGFERTQGSASSFGSTGPGSGSAVATAAGTRSGGFLGKFRRAKQAASPAGSPAPSSVSTGSRKK